VPRRTAVPALQVCYRVERVDSHIALDDIYRFQLASAHLGYTRRSLLGVLSKMLVLSSLLLLGAATVECTLVSPSPQLVNLLGPQGINLLKLSKAQSSGLHVGNNDDSGQAAFFVKPSHFQAHWFRQPVDHFSNNSETWLQRYWINTRHYKPREGAPVIIIDGGETSGENRLPFLDTGIADILPKATGGIGVILEHRCAPFHVVDVNTVESATWLDIMVREVEHTYTVPVC
jgi:hypothetical protein